MAGTTPLTIGADVSCTDGVCGKLSRLVMEPRARTVTHLVVSDRQFQGRLAPLSLVDADPDSSYDQVRWHGPGWLADPPSVTYDTLPAGEVGVRGGEPVHATDGNIGQIQGLVIDSQQPGHPRAPAGGTRIRPQGSGDPDRRCNRSRRERHAAQHH